MQRNKKWFCEECHEPMDEHGDFAKCPACGAEVWYEGEGTYKQEQQEAELAEQLHGAWFCQRCRVKMEPITGDFAKCPECGAEVWYGDGKKAEPSTDEIRELMEDFTRTHASSPYEAMIGGRAAHGGGGSKTGKAKDKRTAMRKPTCEQLYQRLFNS